MTVRGRSEPSPQALRQTADLVVTGRVGRVFTSEEEDGIESVRVFFCIELFVDKNEKGEGPKVDDLIFRRCYVIKQLAPDVRDDGNQSIIPRYGADVRAYLQGSQAPIFSLLAPNGFEPLNNKAAYQPTRLDNSPGQNASRLDSWWLFLLGIGLGGGAGAVITLVWRRRQTGLA